MRKHYIDNIRWSTLLVVMAYHVFYIYNASGIFGGIGSFSEVQYQDMFMYFVYPWFMVLLFVVAGVSAKYSLDKTTGKQFIKARTVKLLVPSTLGLLAFHWIIGLFYIKIGGSIDQIPKFILYPISALSGTGPLWFAQLLWLFSVLIVPIKKLDKNEKFLNLCKKSNTIVLVLLFLVLWGGSQILNAPVITTYRCGIYFAAYLIGYFVLSHDEVQDKIEKIRIPALVLFVVLGILFCYFYFGENFGDADVLKGFLPNVYAWTAVIAAFGSFKAWFNKSSRFTEYMTKANFGLYVLHFAALIFPCYLFMKSGMPVFFAYVLGLASVYLLTPVLYEVIRRIPVFRFLVLGIKK